MVEEPTNQHRETVVIASVSRTTLAIIAFLLIPATIAVIRTPSWWSVAAVLAHILVWYRVSQISVSVSEHGVLVRNFMSDTLVPIWEAETEIEKTAGDSSLFLSDLGGKYDTSGRILYVRRPWNGTRVHVTAAPRFGEELDRIHDELDDAIKAQRAA